MAYENNQVCISVPASTDLSSYQYKAVKMTTDKEIIYCSSTNAGVDLPIGILQNDPTEDEAGNVCVFGVTKVYLAAATSAGQLIGLSTDNLGGAGQLVPVTTGINTVYVIGQCIAGASSSQYATAFVNCANPLRFAAT